MTCFRKRLMVGTICHGAWAALLLPAHPAMADPHPDRPMQLAAAEVAPSVERSATVVRAADHAGYSRVVFDFASPTDFSLRREGNREVAHFATHGEIPGLDTRLRYVGGVEGGNGWAEIALAPGAVIRTTRLDKRVVIDVLPASGMVLAAGADYAGGLAGDAMPATPRPAHPKPAPRHAAAVRHPAAGHLPSVPPPAVAAAADPAPPPPAAAPREPVTAAAPAAPMPDASGAKHDAPMDAAMVPTPPVLPPPPVAALSVPQAPQGPTNAVTLPFATTTGAAAFRRGGTAVVVFDEPRHFDLSGLSDDSVFGAARLQVLPGATVLRVPLDSTKVLRLTRAPAGWTLAVMPGPAKLLPIAPVPIGGDVSLPAARPGQVVTVPDPETGWNLLVGTQLQPGQGLPVARRTSAYVVLASWQGVVVEPRSDRLEMRQVTDGFLLSAPGLDLSVPSVQSVAQTLSNAAGLTRRFDFPNLPDLALLRRMREFVDSAAGLPPLARYQPRREAAEAMIALGLGAEAQSLLLVAATDDPQHADDPEMHGLAGIAALLAGRTGEAGGLDDPALSGTDEIALWRAVRAAQRQEGSPEAAQVFAATLPLLLSYPEPLRQRLLPLVAETLAQGGEADVAAALLARSDSMGNPDLAYAAALVAEARGDIVGALAKFDAVAQSRDERQAARARRHAVELRLSSGRLTPIAAADALSTQFLAWRGDGTELALRQRAAALYAQGGAWRQAIDLLHETMGAYENDRPAIRLQLAQTFTAMLKDAAARDLAMKSGVSSGQPGVSSLDLVTMADENPDLIPPGPEGDELAGLLADRLMALDLPRRAAPVLDKLMRSAPVGSARAELGARLADLKLSDGDGASALLALADSAAQALPAPLDERRGLLTARALARQGDLPKALAQLDTMTSPAADGLRAQLLTDAKDWRGAEAALADMAAKTLPPTGAFSDDNQNLVLRLAGAAAQAGDERALRDLAERFGPRMVNKQLSDMFHLLTENPVTGMADMPAVAADIARAKALPASLTAVTAK